MRRPYTARQFREVAESLSAAVPGIRIGADVITGFPGESESDFGETVRLVRDAPVGYLHAFPYSARPGTESAGWDDDTPPAEKKRRVARLRAIDASRRGAFLAAQVGRTLTVIAESRDPSTGEFRGTSENYAEVAFRGEARVGALHPVRVLSAAGNLLRGRAGGAAFGP
jgi:threonylcarbamoyladenosine tRNA methylthiotransferase MtaB